MTEKEELARLLWDSGALRLTEGEEPLRWDASAVLAEERTREALLDALEAMARDHYASAQALLGGPWAALLAARLGLPLNPAEVPSRVLAVTDAVTDGADLHALAAPLRASGVSIAAAALFNFGFPSARRRLDKADVRLHWLTDLETAAAVALQEGRVDFETYDALLEMPERGDAL
jgi:orotate phosphoribosyltransferase